MKSKTAPRTSQKLQLRHKQKSVYPRAHVGHVAHFTDALYIWFIALVGAIAALCDRYRINRRRRFIEDNQYEQAVEDSKRRQSAGTSENQPTRPKKRPHGDVCER